MQKVVVTGGAGFIGSNLVDALIEKGYEVHVIDNYIDGKREGRINPKATYHDVDLRKVEEIKPILEGADVVFHTAAIPRVPYSIEHPVETTDQNITGTVSVLTAAARQKCAASCIRHPAPHMATRQRAAGRNDDRKSCSSVRRAEICR